MTADGPFLELQIAVVALLRDSDDLKELAGDKNGNVKIYQDVPDKPEFPYLTIGDGQDVPDLAGDPDDENTFIDGSEIFFDIHVWSRGKGGTAEEKKIGAAIRAALNVGSVSLTENRNILLERRNEHHMTDADTITLHGVYTFRALCEPALDI